MRHSRALVRFATAASKISIIKKQIPAFPSNTPARPRHRFLMSISSRVEGRTGDNDSRASNISERERESLVCYLAQKILR